MLIVSSDGLRGRLELDCLDGSVDLRLLFRSDLGIWVEVVLPGTRLVVFAAFSWGFLLVFLCLALGLGLFGFLGFAGGLLLVGLFSGLQCGDLFAEGLVFLGQGVQLLVGLGQAVNKRLCLFLSHGFPLIVRFVRELLLRQLRLLAHRVEHPFGVFLVQRAVLEGQGDGAGVGRDWYDA